jgi:hypothetical protein
VVSPASPNLLFAASAAWIRHIFSADALNDFIAVGVGASTVR